MTVDPRNASVTDCFTPQSPSIYTLRRLERMPPVPERLLSDRLRPFLGVGARDLLSSHFNDGDAVALFLPDCTEALFICQVCKEHAETLPSASNFTPSVVNNLRFLSNIGHSPHSPQNPPSRRSDATTRCHGTVSNLFRLIAPPTALAHEPICLATAP